MGYFDKIDERDLMTKPISTPQNIRNNSSPEEIKDKSGKLPIKQIREEWDGYTSAEIFAVNNWNIVIFS